jgi:hypothetical protein
VAGVQFDIEINAGSIGVDSSAAELNALADKITMTNTVATQFDAAIAAATSRLAEAAAQANLASSALGTAEARYKELEGAANKAAREVEKASLAGKDTGALQAAAQAAALAMREQADAVDMLRAKSTQAAASQAKLANSLKTLEGQASAAAKEIGRVKEPADAAGGALKAIGADEKIGKLKQIANGFKDWRVAAAAGTVALVAMAAGAAYGIFALGKMALSANPEMMERLTAASAKASKNFSAMFKGLKLDRFVAALEDIMDLFAEGSSAANGMKALFETLLQPIFDGAAKLGPFLKEMFKGMVFGLLSVVVEVLRLRNKLREMIPPETREAITAFVDQHLTMENAFKAGAALIVIATVALTAFAVAAIAAAWPILLIVAAIALVVAAFVYWEEILASISEAWWDLDKTLRDAVKNIITGIVNGIKNGAGAVYDAMANMASGAITAFKNKLGIKSPSAVFALQASYTTQGYVEGIEDGKKDVDSALESMVEPPPVAVPSGGKAASGSGGAGASGGAPSVVIQNLTIGDSPVAKQSWDDFKRAVGEVLEGAVITIGGVEA